MTFEELTHLIAAQPAWSWTARWWRFSELIVQTPTRSWSVKNVDATAPRDVTALGCCGKGRDGRCHWLGFDLDVQHGANAYQTTAEAIAAANTLRDALDWRAEIRLSKSGAGVHVRHLFWPEPVEWAVGLAIAKDLVAALGIKTDPAPLGRQQFWLWTKEPKPNAFKLIKEHKDD